MALRPSMRDLKTKIEALPVFVVMEYLYARNAESPIAAAKKPEQKYQELLAYFDKALGQSCSDETAGEIPFTTLFSIAEMILYSLIKDEAIFVQVMNPRYKGPHMPSHCLNTAFLSCKIGILMRLSYRELLELCVAALLHDIGMVKIHPAYYEHDRVLSEEERKVIETHPELGRKLLQKVEKDFPWLLRVVLEEHQRLGDKSYPFDAEVEPHIYSRIVGLCDSFEALTHERSFRKAYHPGDAIKIIIDGKVTHYDKDVLRAATESLSLFPVGSLVQLNTNSIAEVVRSIDGSPLRPIVQIVDAETNNGDSAPRIVDLAKEKNLFITGLVYDERYYIPDQAKAL